MARRGNVKPIVLKLSAANTAIDDTVDLGNVSLDALLLFVAVFPPGAASSVVLTDADTGAPIVNLGIGGNNQAVFVVLSTDGNQQSGGGQVTQSIQPPAMADLSGLYCRRPKRLRIQIGAAGVGLQTTYELIGELNRET